MYLEKKCLNALTSLGRHGRQFGGRHGGVGACSRAKVYSCAFRARQQRRHFNTFDAPVSKTSPTNNFVSGFSQYFCAPCNSRMFQLEKNKLLLFLKLEVFLTSDPVLFFRLRCWKKVAYSLNTGHIHSFSFRCFRKSCAHFVLRPQIASVVIFLSEYIENENFIDMCGALKL